MAIREGRWDCQYCGAVGIQGRHKACGSCGRSRPAGTRFYLPTDAQIVEEEKLLAEARIGPDWVCAFCESSNPANLDVCYSCRAPRDEDARDQAVVSYGLDAVPTLGDNADPEELEAQPAPETPGTPEKTQPAPRRPQPERPRWLIGALVALFLFICGGGAALAIFLNQTEEVTVTVQRLEWERSVEVEVFRTVVEEDWDIPPGGRELDSRREVRSYTQVQVGVRTVSEEIPEQVQVGERTYVCGQRDLGNGFFEDVTCTEPVFETRYRTETREEPVYEQQPVYDTLYEYEIEKWVVDRVEENAGTGADPGWPVLDDDERMGRRDARYVVVFSDAGGERYELALPEAEWRTYRVGETYTAAIDRQGNIEAIDR